MVLPEVKQSPAKAVVAMPINKPLTSVPSDMSCRHVYPKLYFLVVELMKDIKFTSLLIDGLDSFNVL